MLNFTLYKRGIQGNWKLLVIFALVLIMYFTIIIYMFDPKIGSALIEFEKVMPELMAMLGMSTESTTLIGFMSSYLYGFMMIIFPMVFSIICANKLIASLVEKGSMSYLLAAPVKRSTVAITQMSVLLSGIVFLVVFVTILGIVVSEISFPGELEIGRFIFLNVGNLFLHFFISGICYFFSCLFSDTKYAIGFGAGIPALAYIIQMVANAGDKYANAKYFTFLSLFDPDGLVAGETSAILGAFVLLVGSIALFAGAIAIFRTKDLHI